MTFSIGQHIRTTREMTFPEDGFTAPAGSLGTITTHNDYPAESAGTYGVVLEDDPKQLPTLCWPEEINPA